MAAYQGKSDKESVSTPAPQKQGDASSKGKNSSRNNKKSNVRNKQSGESNNAKPSTSETPLETPFEKSLPMNTQPTQTPERKEAPVLQMAAEDDKTRTATAFEVGWMFVQQYYTLMNKSPQRLHCFYKAKSTLVRGEEYEDLVTFYGQKGVHKRIMELDYKNCKVLISNVDVQASLYGSIVILVLGEISNDDGPNRRFTQTFVLVHQERGFYILNDIFRFLKDTSSSDSQQTGFVGVELEDGEFKVVNLAEKDSSASQVNGSAPEVSSDVSEVASLKAEPATPAEETPIESLNEAVKAVENTKNSEPSGVVQDSSADSTKVKTVEAPAAQTENKSETSDASSATKNEKLDINSHVSSKTARSVSTPQESKPASAQKSTWASKAGSGLSSNVESSLLKTPQSQDVPSRGSQSPAQKSHNTRDSNRDYNLSNAICVRGLKEPISKEHVREVFSKFGAIKTLDSGSRLVFIEYVNQDGFKNALSETTRLVGTEEVTLEPRRAKTNQRSSTNRRRDGSRRGTGARTAGSPEGSNSNNRQNRQVGRPPMNPSN